MANVIRFFILTNLMLISFLFAATDDQTPEPLPTSVTGTSSSDNLPLPLFHSLKSKLTAVNSNSDPNDLADLFEEIHSHELEILSALHSEQSLQRELAARVLQFATERRVALAALGSTLAKDNDPAVRAAAADSLGHMADVNAVDSLLIGLRDNEENVRISCIGSLGLLRDERSVAGLLDVLRGDPCAQARFQATYSLIRIGAGYTEQDLLSILDNERDERVKMALAAMIKMKGGADLSQLEPVPDPDDFKQQLATLSGNMRDVETKLRDDRHDEVVQIDEKDIDHKLSELIHQLENAKNISPSQMENKSGEDHNSRLRRMLSGNMQSAGAARSGRKSNGSPHSEEGRLNTATVDAKHDAWATLPSKDRDELLQIYRPEVPLRWRKRIEAYFVSVAAQESTAEPAAKADAKDTKTDK